MKFCDACSRGADLLVSLKVTRQWGKGSKEYDVLLCSLCWHKEGSLEAAIWTVRARQDRAAQVTQQVGV